ncbi:unnamed protein product [Adineta steineri]|uniref:VWFC domain-containing protein n=1 Tax=Adineta steineri TaxID=433720 RepID=A0A818ICD2_9BILA|nr:unnamed protein product [Adineta steineri]CAF3523999.1 unnamed protein product [Adineta steineri]
MTRLSLAIVVAVCIVSIVGINGEKNLKKRDIQIEFGTVPISDVIQWLCAGNPVASLISMCNSYTATSTTKAPLTSSTAAPKSSSGPTQPSTAAQVSTDATSATPLQNAHWCGFSNGTYIPLGYSFMYTACDLCQCTQSHVIRCTKLQCMTTYCIDDSTPSVRSGQCCSQCAYDTNSTQCVQNGVAIPHGAVVKSTSDNILCWCQLGTIECRKSLTSAFSALDLWGQGTAIYIVVIILCVFLIFGTLLCGGCSLLYYYYYYYYNQQSGEQAYWNNAGWQPMGEGEQVVDGDAEKKQAEAEGEQNQYEQNYPTGQSEEYVPPPYALYNGAYETSPADKDAKYI